MYAEALQDLHWPCSGLPCGLLPDCRLALQGSVTTVWDCLLLQGTSAYILNATGYTGRPDEWSNFASQRSMPLDLQAGEVVLLEAAHCQSAYGPSLLQVWTCLNVRPSCTD